MKSDKSASAGETSATFSGPKKLGLTDLPNGSDAASVVCVGDQYWRLYAIAYRDAAAVVSSVLKEKTVFAEHLSAPMMFLYRHSIELHLKALLLSAGQLLDDPQTVPPKHYLRTLWLNVRALLVKIGTTEGNAWMRRAGEIIRQFEDVDPHSFAFRYPVGTDGSPSLTSNMLVDPSVVSQVVSELHLILDAVAEHISVQESREIEAGEWGIEDFEDPDDWF